VRHHSAVELVDRVVSAGLVAREGDPKDARAVRVLLTSLGAGRLELLSGAHLEELSRLSSELHNLWVGLG
jgi:DNA-binding MarR family transcriptional regulator